MQLADTIEQIDLAIDRAEAEERPGAQLTVFRDELLPPLKLLMRTLKSVVPPALLIQSMSDR